MSEDLVIPARIAEVLQSAKPGFRQLGFLSFSKRVMKSLLNPIG